MEEKAGVGYGCCCMLTRKERFLELPTAERLLIKIDYEVLRAGGCFHTKNHFGMALKSAFAVLCWFGLLTRYEHRRTRFSDITKIQVLLRVACADTNRELMQDQ
ncbi:hypothetical protein PsorP6_016694 [Peronosclerospora sorghi]|uniref:Uncharacterized protein n=1 Tax=Peronosclerospora sorghi TaxID=230839 RepID=A0ACC0VLQ9_9STRA|nr:hypothetical protein PsorP6_016694 [Peronosclerospora sorghi]